MPPSHVDYTLKFKVHRATKSSNDFTQNILVIPLSLHFYHINVLPC